MGLKQSKINKFGIFSLKVYKNNHVFSAYFYFISYRLSKQCKLPSLSNWVCRPENYNGSKVQSRQRVGLKQSRVARGSPAFRGSAGWQIACA